MGLFFLGFCRTSKRYLIYLRRDRDRQAVFPFRIADPFPRFPPSLSPWSPGGAAALGILDPESTHRSWIPAGEQVPVRKHLRLPERAESFLPARSLCTYRCIKSRPAITKRVHITCVFGQVRSGSYISEIDFLFLRIEKSQKYFLIIPQQRRPT